MNFDIVRAIERAVADGCDLVNISIQLGSPDEAVQSAIQDAQAKGTVCLAAAGNNYQQPVSYPAKYPEALAISAIGKQGTFPPNSSEAADVMPPFAATDPAVFLAAFSNIGPEISATAPGVGIISTLPGGLYGVQSGTSMACPAVTGFLAARLADQTRSTQC